jgi:hypothetical protein
LAGVLLAAGRPGSHRSQPDDSSTWKAAGLAFTIPDHWTKTALESPARIAQWEIAPPRGQAGDGLEIVVFFFGPGVGGSVKENIDAWADTLAGVDGKPPKADPQTHTVAGHKITQVMLSGTYTQASAQPGIPPAQKPAYSLLGAVVENPAGNLYWRVTGPTAGVLAFAPIFSKALDSLKPQEDKP